MKLYAIHDNLSLSRALKAMHLDLLQEELDERCFFHCKLVFSELASNAAKHTKEGGSIRLEVFEEWVEITLTCKQPLPLPERSSCSSVYEESGRGLYLIDSVCQSRERTENGGWKVIVSRIK
ncbi:MAG: ATP-binding protein [Clostridia bacterium]|nr:ATP-binding protein [Clostridia bacterium]